MQLLQILASLGFAGVITALPGQTRRDEPSPDLTTAAIADQYTWYKGNGSPAAGWPRINEWGSFADLWEANLPLIKGSCGWNNWGANDSPQEIANVKEAIQSVADEAGVDQRFVLAIVMQESKGCVRAHATNNGVRNPGLMQSHNGPGDCEGVNPCPKSEIHQMIVDGTEGTKDGDGLKQTLQQAAQHIGNGKSARAYYTAARIYNAGSADWDDLNNGLGSTNCYSSDVANRLTGWTNAASKCKE